jgi:hypothetical protein
MVIRATDENLSPWLRVCWRKIMAICEPLDLVRRQLTEKSLGEIAQKSVAQTVDSLKMLEKKDEPLEMARLEFAVDAVKRMRNRVRDLGGLEVMLQVKNIIADAFDFPMLLL